MKYLYGKNVLFLKFFFGLLFISENFCYFYSVKRQNITIYLYVEKIKHTIKCTYFFEHVESAFKRVSQF